MKQITVVKSECSIERLCVITPTVQRDNRGYFMETYSQRDMEEAGINITFVQDNQSMLTKSVLRDLHFQKQFLILKGFVHGFLALTDTAKFCYKCDGFYHANDEGVLVWDNPEIGIKWPQVVDEYRGNACAEGYSLEDGTKLNLNDKNQKRFELESIVSKEIH